MSRSLLFRFALALLLLVLLGIAVYHIVPPTRVLKENTQLTNLYPDEGVRVGVEVQEGDFYLIDVFLINQDGPWGWSALVKLTADGLEEIGGRGRSGYQMDCDLLANKEVPVALVPYCRKNDAHYERTNQKLITEEQIWDKTDQNSSAVLEPAGQEFTLVDRVNLYIGDLAHAWKNFTIVFMRRFE